MPQTLIKSPEPIANRLADVIARDLPPKPSGSVKLASRRDLANRYNVSLPTVTNALKLLRKQDLVYWVPGKGIYTGPAPSREAETRCFTVGMFGWFNHVFSPQPGDADTYRLTLLRDLVNVGMDEDCQLPLLPQEPGKSLDMAVLDRFTFDGLIIKDLVDPGGIIRQLRERNIPLITDSVKYREHGVGYVGYDNVAMIRDMVNTFVEHGHRRIASLTLETLTPQQNNMMRHEFYARLMGASCIYDAKRYYRMLDWHDWQQAHNTDILVQYGYDNALEMLKWDDRPTAFFVWAPPMAEGVERAAKELGLRVPEDVSILTDTIDADLSRFSTFVQPHEKLARGLLHRLRQIAGDPLLCIEDDLYKPIVEKGTIAMCHSPP